MTMYSLLKKTTILMLLVMIVHGLFDSSVSFHVSPHGGFFSTYQSGDCGTVKIGNCVTSKIVGIGDITFMNNIRHKLVLKEVRHVPGMCLHPILVEKLDDVVLISHFGDYKWKLTKGNMIVAREKKEGTLYVMQGRICKGEANVAHVTQAWSCGIDDLAI